MNICIIPARGGSKRIPRKNIKHFCGKPMIEWAIAAAQSAGIFERIFVSTDDVEILVQMQVAPGGLPLGIAEHGDNDLRPKAMHSVRRRQVRPCLDFTTFDDFVKPRRSRVGGGIDDMDVGRAHARHQQIAAAHRTVIET